MSTPIMTTSRGFSLVEVLVALFVISVGMLGIAKMQALAISSTGTAGSRAIVALEAAGLASAMHANRAYWANPGGTGGSLYTNISASSGTAAVMLGEGNTTSAVDVTQDCVADTCDGYHMALVDLQNFGTALAQVVPAANAFVTCQDTTVPLSCIITIKWLENIPGMTPQTSSAALSSADEGGSGPDTDHLIQRPQYTLYVEP